MTDLHYQAPTTDPDARLRELQSDTTVSPEIADLRLAILRREFPDAVVQVDAVRADDIAIAVKVTVALPTGARSSVIAADDVDSESGWASQMEMVQAIAIARALDGLGTQIAQERTQKPRQSPQAAQSTTSPADGDHLPEYSWNAFWQTMNTRNITRDQVQQALGKSVQEATPKDAVDALKAAGILT